MKEKECPWRHPKICRACNGIAENNPEVDFCYICHELKQDFTNKQFEELQRDLQQIERK